MIDIRPFELLKLIRDRKIRNKRDLEIISPRFSSAVYFEIYGDRLLKDWQELGWITVNENGDIHPTERIIEVQKALDISLSPLSPYLRSCSIVANPLFGLPEKPPIQSDLFVLMPFEIELRPVYDDHIKSVADEIGITLSRADDFFYSKLYYFRCLECN